ncbi:hypothetical protein F4821DRAFT_259591 [Hypoxylon rubiginosum]|uniref:Uncharacterized protein n=1 Tax=Hypoxylon rubiginosum TaxID=110542 RepID=A0ACC0D2C0_9PEZI|nr:hypothetical protein F4821DRAFT_259591 [Hypoxylon rubiginosum]
MEFPGFEDDQADGMQVCDACQELKLADEVARLACGHHYCGECLDEIYRNATVDEESFPPRCCGQPVDLEEMGLKTNMKWLHSINRDMRANKDKSPEQLAYNGERISLTLRSTATLYKTGQQLARMSSEYTKILQLPSLPPLTRPGVQQLSSGLYKSPFDPNLGSPAAAQGDTPPTTQSDLPRPPETIRTARATSKTWSTTFEDAWEEWNEAKAYYEDDRTTEDFLIFWAKAEHTLTLAGHRNLLDTPELLPHLLGWLGYALRPAAGHMNGGNGVPHYQSSDSMDTSASDSDRSRDNPFDGTEQDAQAHEIVNKTICMAKAPTFYI